MYQLIILTPLLPSLPQIIMNLSQWACCTLPLLLLYKQCSLPANIQSSCRLENGARVSKTGTNTVVALQRSLSVRGLHHPWGQHPRGWNSPSKHATTDKVSLNRYKMSIMWYNVYKKLYFSITFRRIKPCSQKYGYIPTVCCFHSTVVVNGTAFELLRVLQK